MEAGKYSAFQVRLNSRSEPRTKLVVKTPNPQILARVSLCWPPMSVCGKNVYALRACKRSNRDFLRLYTGNTYTFSLIQSSSITRRVLRCLLGFLPSGAKNPAGAIIHESFQPKIGRKIRIFSLGRKNNIVIKEKSVRENESRTEVRCKQKYRFTVGIYVN